MGQQLNHFTAANQDWLLGVEVIINPFFNELFSLKGRFKLQDGKRKKGNN
jgi:hypothetical protein